MSTRTFKIDGNTGDTVAIQFQTQGNTCPYIRFNGTTGVFEISNDGTTTSPIPTGMVVDIENGGYMGLASNAGRLVFADDTVDTITVQDASFIANGILNVATATNFQLGSVAYTGSMADLNNLRNDSLVDSLHRHSELSASDGSPNPALQVDASGKVGIGTTSPVAKIHSSLDGTTVSTKLYNGNEYLLGSANSIDALIRLVVAGGASVRPQLTFIKANNTIADPTAVVANDALGMIVSGGYDGTNRLPATGIEFSVDGTPGTNDMPGRMVFSTTADGGSSLSERMRITCEGYIGVGTSSPQALLSVGKAANATLANIQTVTANNAVNIQIPTFATTRYFPGLVWSTYDSNPTKPKAGIWGMMDSVGGYLMMGTTDSWSTGINNTAVTINPSGNVGIGTTAPISPLEVRGAEDTYPVRVSAGLTSGLVGYGFRGYVSGTGSTKAAIALIRTSAYGTGDLVFLNRSGSSDESSATIADERMRITRTGYVGIGNAAPDAMLDIRDGSLYMSSATVTHAMTVGLFATNVFGAFKQYSNADGGLSIFGVTDTNGTSLPLMMTGIIGHNTPASTTSAVTFRSGKKDAGGTSYTALGSTDTSFQFLNNATALATILGDGKLGLGTVTPGSALDIYGVGSIIRISSATSQAADTLLGGLRARNVDSGTNPGGIGFYQGSATNSGYITVFTNTGSSEVERLRITKDGYVGINNTTPFSRFELSDSAANLTSYLSTWSDTQAHNSNLNFLKSASNTVNTLSATGSGELLGQINFMGVVTSSRSSAAYIRGVQDGASGANYIIPGMIVLATATSTSAATERLRVNSYGNVGINTTAPVSRLGVTGTISTSNGATLVTNGTFTTDTTGWTVGSYAATLSVVSNRLRITAGVSNYGSAYQAVATEVGKVYKITYTCYAAGGAGWSYNRIDIGTAQLANSGYAAYSSTTFPSSSALPITESVVFRATSALCYINLLVSGASATSDWDDISVVEMGYVGVGISSPAGRLHSSFDGTTISPALYSGSYETFIGSGDSIDAGIRLIASGGATVKPGLTFQKVNGTVAAPSVSVNGDSLGAITAQGYSNASRRTAATIEFAVDAAVDNSVSEMPGRIVFSTSADGSATPTERLRISADGVSRFSGQIRINKLSGPTAYFYDDDNACIYTTYGTGSTYPFTGYGNLVIMPRTGSGTDIVFATATNPGSNPPTTVMVIKSTGYVGMNTTSPSGQLHVVNSAFASTALFERSGQTTDGVSSGIRCLTTKTSNMGNGFGTGISFLIQDDAAVLNEIGSVGAVRNGADNSGDVIIKTVSAGTGAEVMRIDSSGRVGISTTSPVAKLDVSSGVQTGSFLLGADTNLSTRTNAVTKLGTIVCPHSTSSEEHMAVIGGYSSNGGSNVVMLGGGGIFTNCNAATAITFHTAADATTLSGTERMRISSTGSVYINDTDNTFAPGGLTVNVTSAASPNNQSISLKNSGTVHLFTDLSENDTFGYLRANSTTDGGLAVIGMSDVGTNNGLVMIGCLGSATPTATVPAVVIDGEKLSANTTGALAASETVLQIRNKNTNLITVLGDGKTGFGTVTPGVDLDVSSASTPVIRAITTSSSGSGILRAQNDNSVTADIKVDGSAVASTLFGVNRTNLASLVATGGNLAIGTYNGYDVTIGANSTALMTLKSSGNVGIGTTAPSGILEVSHATTSHGSLYVSNRSSSNSDGLGGVLYLGKLGAVPDSSKHVGALWFEAKTSDSITHLAGIEAYTVTGATTRQLMTGTMHFKTKGTAADDPSIRMTIDQAGNVGVGTTAPLWRLQVADTANLGRYFAVQNDGATAIKKNDNSIVAALVLSNAQSGAADYGTCVYFEHGYGGSTTVAGTSVASGKIVVAGEQSWTSTASTQDSYMSFSTTADGTCSERMRIRSTGQVDFTGTYLAPLNLGGKYLWNDGSGNYRTKTTLPASATDGNILMEALP